MRAAVFTSLVFILACDSAPDPRRTNFRVERGNVAAHYDDKTGRLTRLEVDSDKNGKIDTWTFMDGTRVDLIEIDRDEDGKIERWEYFTDNKLARVGTSSRGDGTVDEWAFQRPDGTLERVETDADRDGAIDTWEEFDPPAAAGAAPILRAVSRDTRKTGQPTERLVYGADGRFERAETVPR